MNVNCRVYGALKKNLKHILDCRELKKVVKMDLRLAVEEVMTENNVLDNNLERAN